MSKLTVKRTESFLPLGRGIYVNPVLRTIIHQDSTNFNPRQEVSSKLSAGE